MPKLSDLIPTNLESEKEKFFASGFRYNPQFTYKIHTPKRDLSRHGKPKLLYLFLAKRILQKHLKEKNSVEQIQKSKFFLDQDEIEDLIEKRLNFYNLNSDYKIVFSKNFVSRIAVNNNEKVIKIRLPVTIDRDEIEAILSHEIDTHIVRQLNYERQTWFKKKRSNDFRSYLRTEEGLAGLNELIINKNRLAYKSAINYLAVNLALKQDFVTVFNFFYKNLKDTERAWTWTLKKKRGMRDTSKKGAFTKDLVYFEGLIEVLIYLKKNNYNPSELYYGKINLKDISKAKKLGISERLILPKIYTDNPELYKQTVREIFKSNLF